MIAPAMVVGIHLYKPNLFKIVVNPSQEVNTSESKNILKHSFIFGMFTSYYNKLNKWIRWLFNILCIIILKKLGVFYYFKIILGYLIKYQIEFLCLSLFLSILMIIYLGLSLYLIMNFKIKDDLKIPKHYPQFIHNFYHEKLHIARKNELYDAYKNLYSHFLILYTMGLIFLIFLITISFIT